jgi:bacterioferritin B
MSDLLAIAERAGDRWSDIEDFIAREHPGDEGGDPTSPTPAGG